MATQEIKGYPPNESGVIQEVDEEQNPEEQSSANRHSILKGEKANNAAGSKENGDEGGVRSSKNSKGAHGTKKNFNKDERIQKSMDDTESQQKANQLAEMQATGQVAVPAKLSSDHNNGDEDDHEQKATNSQQKQLDLGSTGEFNVA